VLPSPRIRVHSVCTIAVKGAFGFDGMRMLMSRCCKPPSREMGAVCVSCVTDELVTKKRNAVAEKRRALFFTADLSAVVIIAKSSPGGVAFVPQEIFVVSFELNLLAPMAAAIPDAALRLARSAMRDAPG